MAIGCDNSGADVASNGELIELDGGSDCSSEELNQLIVQSIHVDTHQITVGLDVEDVRKRCACLVEVG